MSEQSTFDSLVTDNAILVYCEEYRSVYSKQAFVVVCLSRVIPGLEAYGYVEFFDPMFFV